MTDNYKDLRDALTPIPEPEWIDQGNGVKIRDVADVNDWLKSKNPFGEFTKTIRALLDERDALREALWVATEHNALHFGESNNTVTQGRTALAQHQGEKNV